MLLYYDQIMNHYIQTVKTFVTTYKKEFIIGTTVVLGVSIIAVLIALFMYNNSSKIIYEPVKACDLFTPSEAQDLLGDKVINVNTNKATIVGDMATSKCSYTDSNPEQDKMLVAAVAVRSGVNDKGVERNKTEFAAAKQSDGIENIKDLGQSAFFAQEQGQLNVLDGRKWVIISYGVGASPETNTIEKVVELAHRALR